MAFPTTLIPVKNQLYPASISEGWIYLFEIYWPGTCGTHYITNNNYDVWWPLPGGHIYHRSSCGVGELDESGTGKLPRFSVWIHLPNRALTPYLDATSGGKGVEVRAIVVNRGYMSVTQPALDLRFRVVDTVEDSIGQVNFELGIRNPCTRVVCRRMLQKSCTYREPFRGILCAYPGDETSCDRTFTRCLELNNTTHTGCFPAMGRGGLSD